MQGSVLDRSFMHSLGTFDIVYCWGVAHHTGDMWKALDNLALNVKSGGLLFIAIYNTVDGRLGSRYWHRIKKMYVAMPRPIQVLMEWFYLSIHILRILTAGKNPWRVMKAYRKKRGMSYRHDLNDWLGGFPYEHAKVEELFSFYQNRGFDLVKLKTTNSIGNNQLLLRKSKT
jgi:2-polyprenyl-3-methyl-5-hydroxy-6-metoxy-1,4-benzoquinol methylase